MKKDEVDCKYPDLTNCPTCIINGDNGELSEEIHAKYGLCIMPDADEVEQMQAIHMHGACRG